MIDLDLFRHPQAVGYFDDIDTIQKRLVIAVVTKRLPFGLVGVGQNHAIERNRAHALGRIVVALLGSGQQRVEHLDGSLEHLHKLHQPLVGTAQPAGEAVGIRIVLGVKLQLTNIDFADQR